MNFMKYDAVKFSLLNDANETFAWNFYNFFLSDFE
jgi:hypothetical protein